jgi:uncharacterized protein (UPF0212 family)
MGLVDRLKRTVLSVLGIHPRRNRTSEPTDSPNRTDQAEDSASAFTADPESSGSEAPKDRDRATPDSDAETETRGMDEENTDAETTAQGNGQATESAAEEESGSETVGSGLVEEREGDAVAEAEHRSDEEHQVKADEPGDEDDSIATDTVDPMVEPVPEDSEEDKATEETDLNTEGVETGFEFGEPEVDLGSSDSEQGVEPGQVEDEPEKADEDHVSVEPETDEPEGGDIEDEPDVEESMRDESEAAVEPDEEESPEPDEVEEEPESSLEEEPEGPGESESAEIETDSSVESGGDGEADSAFEEPDIDIFDGDIEPLEPDSDGQEPDSIVEHEPGDATTEVSGGEQEPITRTPTSERQISYALDPEGKEVHVDTAEAGNPYICPDCEGPLELRTSDKIRDYFAHEWGWLDKHDCSLGSSRTPSEREDVEPEPDEIQRQLSIFFGCSTRSLLRLSGKIPALNVDDFDDPANIPAELENLQVDTQGTQDHPRSGWFSPDNSQVDVGLSPYADEYQITLQADGRFESIEGDWSANGLEPGDVFVGEKAQAKRIKKESPVVKEGQWVYVVLDGPPETVPDAVEIYHAGSRDILGVEVTDDKLGLLQQYADVEPSGAASFGADVLLPRDADPRSETVHGPPGTKVLVGIQHTGESDSVFHIVVPGNKERNSVIDAAGEGTPRFFVSEIPQDGVGRHDIHGLGEGESIELIASDDQDGADRPWTDEPVIGVHVDDGDGDTQLLNPIRGPTSHTFEPKIDADSIMDSLAFEGPDGHRFEIKAEFPDGVDFASVLRRTEVTAEEARTVISTWIREGCDRIEIDFDAAGKTELVFDRELDCRVVLEAGVTVHDVDTEEEAISIAFNIIAGEINPDLGYVDIAAQDGPCIHCGEEHDPAFVAADTALVRLQLTMNVYGVENTTHAERIAKAEIGKRVQGIPLKTVEVERQ